MKALHRVAVLALVAAPLATLTAPLPASATVTTTVVSSHLEIAATGAANLTFGCSGGKTWVNATASTLDCTAITYVKVTGDGAAQSVDGRGLDAAAFTQHPYLSVDLAGGNDSVTDTKQIDAIAMGEGYDSVDVQADGLGNIIDLGTNSSGGEADHFDLIGLDTGDVVAVKESSSSSTFQVTNAGGSHSYVANHAEYLAVYGNGGADTVDASALASGGFVKGFAAYGGDGDDALTGGGVASAIFGNAGTNTLTGGPASADVLYSDSSTDTVDGGGGSDAIIDETSLRMGGRNLTSTTGTQSWQLNMPDGQMVTDVRPTSATSALVTTSLNRGGQQALGSTVNVLRIYTSPTTTSGPVDHPMADVAALQGKEVQVHGDGADDDLADVTMPSAAWTASGDPSTTYTISPNVSGYSPVSLYSLGTVSVHAPWPNAYQSFAHRITRDLLFRFPTESVRNLLADQLHAGTKTRAQAIAELMDTDEYRSLDVDRTFVKYLHRAPDSSGRVYWIGSLADGKPLWRFRAQLIGSNEYFTKAGGTNAKYMVQAYADVMGRAPDAGGQAFWTGKLDAGVDRGSVALQFLSSTEARRNLVKDEFLRFVGRVPTTTEANTWIATLGSSPSGEQDLIAYLANSNAYYARS